MAGNYEKGGQQRGHLEGWTRAEGNMRDMRGMGRTLVVRRKEKWKKHKKSSWGYDRESAEERYGKR